MGLRERGERKEGEFPPTGGIHYDVIVSVGGKGLFAPYQLPVDLRENGVYPSIRQSDACSVSAALAIRGPFVATVATFTLFAG